MPLVVGVDLGTQSLKAVLCDERLTVLAEHSVPISTRHPQPGRAEQDAQTWWAAFVEAVAAVAHGKPIAALGIAGQLDGCLPVDERGLPLGPALIWQDRRAIAE